jgi:hypothetical protein
MHHSKVYEYCQGARKADIRSEPRSEFTGWTALSSGICEYNAFQFPSRDPKALQTLDYWSRAGNSLHLSSIIADPTMIAHRVPFSQMGFLVSRGGLVRSEFWAERDSSTLSAGDTATFTAQLKAIFQDMGYLEHNSSFAIRTAFSFWRSILFHRVT